MPETDDRDVPLAVVLCGGQSSRMGQDKGGLMFGKERLLQRVCRLTSAAAHSLVVVAAADQRLPELSGCSDKCLVVSDAYPGQGPLGGLLTGMQTLRQKHSPADWARATVWATACDSPFVNPAVIRYLQAKLLQCPRPAIVVQQAGLLHPLAAVYRSSVLPVVGELFDDGVRSLQELLQKLEPEVVAANALQPLDTELLFLHNVNTPADYQAALQKMQQWPDGRHSTDDAVAYDQS